MKNVIGIIPARGGSKRLPNKNTKILAGKPLIEHTIKAAKKSNYLDDIIVSTDDEKIANISKKLGVKAPFLRPAEISGSEAYDRDVILHILNYLNRKSKLQYSIFVYLRPTSPFRKASNIDKVIGELIDSNNYTGLRTVTKVEGVYHPYWIFREINGVIHPVVEGVKIENYYQSQMLPPCYRLNGAVDAGRTEIIVDNKNIYGDNIGINILESPIDHDIDTQLDFDLAEFYISKYNLIRKS